MTTRYGVMIEWSLLYTTFCLTIIGLYSVLERSIVPTNISINKKKIFSINISDIIVALILIIITGIRCNCGSDYYNYYEMYSSAEDWYRSFADIFNERFQNGYMALCFIVKKLGGGEYSIFPVVSVITILPVVPIMRKRCNYPVQGLSCWMLLGFFMMTTNIIKQAVAMSMLILAFDFAEDKKYIRAIIFGMLAFLFHWTVIYIIIVVAFVCLFHWGHIKVNLKTYFTFVIIGCISVAFLPQILRILIRFLPNRYVSYVQLFLLGESNDLKLMIGGIITSTFYLILLYHITNIYENKKYLLNNFEYNIMLLSYFCIPVLFIGIRYYIFNRIAYMGLQFLVFLIPEYYNKTVGKSGKDGKLISKNYFFKSNFFIIMIIFCVMFSILCAENNYYHYGTIFNEIPVSVRTFANQ